MAKASLRIGFCDLRLTLGFQPFKQDLAFNPFEFFAISLRFVKSLSESLISRFAHLLRILLNESLDGVDGSSAIPHPLPFTFRLTPS
jgi:hypothetical protein